MTTSDSPANGQEGHWFTVLICCYGDYPHYSLRAVESVVRGRDLESHCTVVVGLNECCRKTQKQCRKLYDRGRIDTLVESRRNINKNPMMRILLPRVTTPYFLWLDDDSHFIDPAWPALFSKLIADEHPFDAAGHVFFWNSTPASEPLLWESFSRKPWWRGEGQGQRPIDDTRIFFPTGGAYLVNTAFARRHGFPDLALVNRHEDIVLGELLNQQHGKLIEYPREIMDRIKISDGDRRGAGDLAAGIRSCDPITGE